MDRSVYLFVVFWSFSLVSCNKCSKDLHETLKKNFNLTQACDECKILGFNIYSWSGFCANNSFYFLKEWNCHSHNLNNHLFVLIKNESCEKIKDDGLNESCFKIFYTETCGRLPERKIWEETEAEKYLNRKERNIVINEGNADASFWKESNLGRRVRSSTEIFTTKKSTSTTVSQPSEVTESTKISSTASTTSTASSESTSTTSTTSSESTSITSTASSESTPTTSTSSSESTSTTSTASSVVTKITSTPTTTFTALSSLITTTIPKSTTKNNQVIEKTCELNEIFFKDHCYFIKSLQNYFKLPSNGVKVNHRGENLDDKNFNICQVGHPKALGLAVETQEENSFVLNFLQKLHFFESSTLYTSGVKIQGLLDEWSGWNKKINKSVININDTHFESNGSRYCIEPWNSYWYLCGSNLSRGSLNKSFIICERLHNPKNIHSDLHETCLQLYRESSCYNLQQHSNYCCAKDDVGEIWFACPGETKRKIYPNNYECSWTCEEEGFHFDKPICRGKYICSDTYASLRYIAPVSRHAISGCPIPLAGHSVWYCGEDRKFVGLPDFSLCCRERNHCTDVDVFLNVWMGCPSTKIVKKTPCPSGSVLKEALVEWYCHKNGTFNGTAPDYSKCNISQAKCVKKDRFGIEWEAEVNTIGKKKCPVPFTGNCYWKCLKQGVFEEPEPDCSRCRAPWMEEIAEKIKNQCKYDEVMETMKNYTEKEDLRLGYSYVLNLTDECIHLFKKQTTDFEVSVFDQFLRTYSSILKNLAGNINVWSSFSASNREEYVKKVLKTTENAAFANLQYESVKDTKYNATLAHSKADGFDFLVAYNPSLGIEFPLENTSESNWYLNLQSINENTSSVFGAMGLVMNFSLSSLMFPKRNKTQNLELNAPAVTFMIASARNGEIIKERDVVVNISFRHRNRTRFPDSLIIRRRLHEREQPSGVFNSTLCHYYGDFDWNTEGCTVTYTTKDLTNCTCHHLSTIALLMSIHQYEPNETLELVSIISSGISIVSLILVLLVFFFCDTVKNDRVLIGKNLCFCLLTGHILLITVMDKKFFDIPDSACTIWAIILHYVFMAAFAWMFVEGCHLYRMLILVFDSGIEYRQIYVLIGYGLPLLLVGATELVGFIFQEQPYGQDELCWLKAPNYVWAFIGPVVVMTSINFCILITATKLAISSKRRTEKSNIVNVLLWMKSWISLSTLLGITWMFALAYIHYNEMFVYTFVVLNGLQGFFIFVFRCLLSEQYKTVVLKKIKLLFSKCKSKDQKNQGGRIGKSDTKLYIITGSKSSTNETDSKDSGCGSGAEKVEDSNENINAALKFKTKSEKKLKKKFSGVDIDVNITLTPAMSEAYLRNRMLSKNFSARKSKATLLGDSDNFAELSYHNLHNPN